MEKQELLDSRNMVNSSKNSIDILFYIYKDADIFMNRKYQNARIVRNSNWKGLKFGEPASGIPSQALKKEGVTT